MPNSEYECPGCHSVFSGEVYSKSAFCPNCGMHLWPKRVKDVSPRKEAQEIEPIQLTRDQINMDTLFEEFTRLKNFNCGEGIVFDHVPSWIMARKKAYADFRGRFSKDKLVDWEKLRDDYQDFLHFKNNLSWTTLYRSGLKALDDLKKLWKLLVFIQDESIDVRTRVKEGLIGRYRTPGIGPNILTALLHTFNPDKYGVWNSRTIDTLDIIRRTPPRITGPGYKYELINSELKQLKNELGTDLTTIDSFMWFISKKVQIIQP